MENFIRRKKKQLIIYRVLYIVELVAALATLLLDKFNILNSQDTLFSALIGAAAAMLVFALQTKKALKDPERLKKLYVAETDERRISINLSSSHLANNLFAVILIIGIIVSAFLDTKIYGALFIVAVIWLACKVISELYFNKKY